MDDSKTSSQTSDNVQAQLNIAQELGHITEEIYKKNAELAHTNKTLSILRKIDDIILSSVTSLSEVAQQVSTTIAKEAEFKSVSVLLLNEEEKSIVRLAISQTEDLKKAEETLRVKLNTLKVSLMETSNLLVRSFYQKTIFTTRELYDIYLPHLTKEQAANLQKIEKVDYLFVFPLVVRGDAIGIMTVGMQGEESALPDYLRDLIYRLVGVVGIAIDNSLLYKEIQEANEKLKQLDKLKDEFVSIASHELRTPMTAIKSYVWLVLNDEETKKLSDKQKLHLQRTYDSTERLIKLVNDMLNVSRIEGGRIKIDPKIIDYAKLVDDVIQELMPRADELKVKVTWEKEIEKIPPVIADPDKIKEVIINLVGNSLKFVNPGTGVIKVSINMQNDMVLTKVVDNGVGIKKEDLSKLFQKFGIIADSYPQKSTTQGTGLGLYISKSIIELQSGKMWAQSEGEGKGTIFYFTLSPYKHWPEDGSMEICQPAVTTPTNGFYVKAPQGNIK